MKESRSTKKTNHPLSQKSNRLSHGFWNLLPIFLTMIILTVSFAAGVSAGFFASLVKDEPVLSYSTMKKNIYDYTQNSNLYFANHVFLGKMNSDLVRDEVKLNQVSDDLIHAVIATEDEYFYQHNGIVPKSILRALFQKITHSPIQTGGSTLTQQLIKNQILTNEVSFQRKANEMLLALRLEKFFSKKEILEAYLNISTFGRNSSGRNIAGVGTAAEGIFGKNAKNLTLPEAAFIAGLPQSPFAYTPFTKEGMMKSNLQPGISRMKTVLKRMYEGGFISKKQYAKASSYDISKDFAQLKDNPIEKYPWLTAEIERRSSEVLAAFLAKNDGIDEKMLNRERSLKTKYETLAVQDLRQKGYEIHTTIDKDIFEAMQKAKDQYPSYGPDQPQIVRNPETGKNVTIMEPIEVGAILIENKTGKIISFVGGRDYHRQQLNHATSAIRQNGSTMKPLLVYAPAFELGMASPASILPDVALKLNPDDPDNPWPHNYDLRYKGLVSARYALANSINVPAVWLYKKILGQNPARYLERMGLTSLTKEDYTNLATSIGSLKNGVTVEENTNAFTTFANRGKFIDAYLIDKIIDKHGKMIYQHVVKPVDVFSPQTAFLTFDIMRDVIRKGTAAGINAELKFKADWAGKTGTGVDYKDSWFVAANPNVTFGIWTGYDTPKSLRSPGGLTYSQRTNNLWADLINSAYDVKPEFIAPKRNFRAPDGIVKLSYCAVSGSLPSETCSKAGLVESDYFNSKFAPKEKDDSLIIGEYVEINDRKYLADDSTPSDFAHKGIMLNPDFIYHFIGNNFKNINMLIPKKELWKNIFVSEGRIIENGKPPSAVTLTVSGKTLSWNGVPEDDIIGYRVYKDGFFIKKEASINKGDSLSYMASNGVYCVTAVDIQGNESPASNLVKVGENPQRPK